MRCSYNLNASDDVMMIVSRDDEMMQFTYLPILIK